MNETFQLTHTHDTNIMNEHPHNMTIMNDTYIQYPHLEWHTHKHAQT